MSNIVSATLFILAAAAFLVALFTSSEMFSHPDNALEFVIVTVASASGFLALGWIVFGFSKTRRRYTLIAGLFATGAGLVLLLRAMGWL